MISALLLVWALTAAADEDPSAKANSETSAAEATADETPPERAPSEVPKTESADEGADPANAGEKPAEEKKPTLRLRRSKAVKEDKEANLDALEQRKPAPAEEPPQVPDRNIPNPDDMKVEPSELDKELLGELGQDLEAAQDEEDPLLRAGRRMREVEEKLARLELGDETVQLQDKILADLDELLKQKQNGKPPPKNQPQNQKKNQNDQQQMAQQQQQRQSGQQRQEKQSNDSRDGAGPARQGREEFGTPKEVKDVWGHLSELMREEMSQYAKEGFLEKYREMLEQYYSTIATRSSGSE